MTRRSAPSEPERFRLDFAFVLLAVLIAAIVAALTWELWMQHS